jgi:hypothetical protein
MREALSNGAVPRENTSKEYADRPRKGDHLYLNSPRASF